MLKCFILGLKSDPKNLKSRIITRFYSKRSALSRKTLPLFLFSFFFSFSLRHFTLCGIVQHRMLLHDASLLLSSNTPHTMMQRIPFLSYCVCRADSQSMFFLSRIHTLMRKNVNSAMLARLMNSQKAVISMQWGCDKVSMIYKVDCFIYCIVSVEQTLYVGCVCAACIFTPKKPG